VGLDLPGGQGFTVFVGDGSANLTFPERIPAIGVGVLCRNVFAHCDDEVQVVGD